MSITGEGFSATIGGRDGTRSDAGGALTSLRVAGKELLASPLQPNFWRVPVDNDISAKWDRLHQEAYGGMPRRQGMWRRAGQHREVVRVTAEQLSKQVARVQVEAILPVGQTHYRTYQVYPGVREQVPAGPVNYRCTYTLFGSGDIIVESAFHPGEMLVADLPRFGMQVALPNEFDTLTWLGRGPQENYCDRHTGAPVGRYSLSVAKEVCPYVRPQEYGQRTDVRWMSLTNRQGIGLLAVGLPALEISAWPHTMSDLERAWHSHELPPRDLVTLNLDYRQMGVGGDDGWGGTPHAPYTLPCQPYSYRFRLRAYAPAMGDVDHIIRLSFPEE